MKIKTLNIADFNINILYQENEILGIEEGYINFISKEVSSKPDLKIFVNKGIPNLSTNDNKIFEAKNEYQVYFSIYKNDNYIKIITYNPSNNIEIQQVAIVSLDYREWNIYVAPLDDGSLCPLLYPMGPLVLYHLTLFNDAIMVHGSAVSDGKFCRIFSGFSGVGKSTMAKIWEKNGATIINDDRLIIRKIDNKYFVYNTPMFYVDINKKSQLNSINLIYHSKENKIEKIENAEAVSSFMAFCIQHSYNKEIIQHHLEFLSTLSKTIPIHKVGFLPDDRIVDIIKNYV